MKQTKQTRPLISRKALAAHVKTAMEETRTRMRANAARLIDEAFREVWKEPEDGTASAFQPARAAGKTPVNFCAEKSQSLNNIMPDPIYSTGRERAQATLKQYLALNKRNCRELIARKAKSFAIEAYKATKAVAPTPQKIKQDVLALGWRVRRKKGAWPLKKGEKRGSPGPLNRMRASVIGRRQRAIGSVAAGYIPALTALGGKVPGGNASTFRQPLGSVEVLAGADTAPGLCVTNAQPGSVAVEKKHGIVDTALGKIEADMQIYISRKQEETARAVKS